MTTVLHRGIPQGTGEYCTDNDCKCHFAPPMTNDAPRSKQYVQRICTAYESGFGRGLSGRDLAQPYADGCEEAEGYFIGYSIGLKRRADEKSDGQVSRLLDALAAKQAKIDALMLEFCPGEMSKAQREEWAKHQRTADETPARLTPAEEDVMFRALRRAGKVPDETLSHDKPSLETPAPRADGLDRLCELCNQPLGKHTVPPYGQTDPRAGALGIICPTEETGALRSAPMCQVHLIVLDKFGICPECDATVDRLVRRKLAPR